MNTKILNKLQKALDFTKEWTGVVQEVLNEYRNPQKTSQSDEKNGVDIEYVFNNMNNLDRDYVESVVSLSAEFALKYAQKIQDRFEKGEDAILRNSEVCLEYLRLLLSLNKDVPASVLSAIRNYYPIF